MATNIIILLGIVIVFALVFTLTNGLHDASSVVATFIACGAGSPVQAIGLAAVFGLIGALLGGSAVADTVSKIIDLPASPVLLIMLLSAMIGAVIWNVITWQLGLPSSSTHALIGGIIGAVWISNGYTHILWGWNDLTGPLHQLTGIVKVIAALIFSPVLGFAISFILQKIVNLMLRNAEFSINKTINRLQWVISALLAYSHGANDTQKITGIVTLALVYSGYTTVHTVPLWVKLCAGSVMFIGTMLGGWPIMKTIGKGIFTIRPIHSLNSQISSGGSVIIATLLGAPVSTTHVVVGSVMGVGAADEFRMVNWNIGKEIITAWCITIPCAAIVSAIVYYPVYWITNII
jgi:inorganic phosphate transporter, PiT family